jgi:cysteine desulfurase
MLDEKGFQVATGSACEASNGQPSHVLNALGLEPAVVNGSLRITLGRMTTQKSLDRLAQELAKIVALS